MAGESKPKKRFAIGGWEGVMAAQALKCGCYFDGKSFTKYCREHALKVLQARWAKLIGERDGGQGNG